MHRSRQLRAKGVSGPRFNPWLRRLALALLVLAILPIVQVAAVRWVDPPFTTLMLVRKVESLVSGRKEPTRYEWLALQGIPRDFLTCALIAEDQRFFRHEGFDWKEIQAARERARQKGTGVRGASTISMQCARSVFLWQGRSWIRKGLEAYYTFWMEQFLTKTRILELYANSVELGPGIFGIKAAATAHYGVKVEKLSRDQCIRLAAMLPAPLKWNPHRPSPRYQRRIERLTRIFPRTQIPGWPLDQGPRR